MKKYALLCALCSICFIACAEENPQEVGGNGNENSATCKDGEFRCVGNGSKDREECSGGKWVAASACSSDNVCRKGQCVEGNNENNNPDNNNPNNNNPDNNNPNNNNPDNNDPNNNNPEDNPGEEEIPNWGTPLTVSCDAPFDIRVGEPYSGSTNTTSKKYSAKYCDTEEINLEGPEAIHKINIAEAGFYKIKVSATEPSEGFTFYVRRNCGEQSSDYTNACEYQVSASSRTRQIYLPGGDNYIFVESNTPKKKAEYTINVDRNDQAVGLCGSTKQTDIITYFNIEEGLHVADADLFNGNSEYKYSSKGSCANIPQQAGKELIYAFHVAKPVRIKATLTPTELSKSSAKVIMYLNKCVSSDLSGNVEECSAATMGAEDLGTVSLEASLTTPGPYYLIVDSNTGYEYKFNLDISLK